MKPLLRPNTTIARLRRARGPALLAALVVILAFSVGCNFQRQSRTLEPAPSSKESPNTESTPAGQILVIVETQDMVSGEPIGNVPLVVSWDDNPKSGAVAKQSIRLRTDEAGRNEFRLGRIGTVVDISVDLSEPTAFRGGARTTIWADSSVVIVKVLEQTG